MSDLSIGEMLIGRRLHKETYVTSTRYKPGQHKAKAFTPKDAVVSYVDREGLLCIIVAEYVDDEWIARDLMIVVSLQHAEVRRMPRSARLSEETVRALQKSVNKQLRPAAGQTT